MELKRLHAAASERVKAVSAQKGRRAFKMVRAANRQEEAQQRQAHHFGHQYTMWKTEGVDEDTGKRVLCRLTPDRWRRKEDGSMEAVFEKPEDGTERARRSVWTRLTRLLYIESRNEGADEAENDDDDDVQAQLFRFVRRRLAHDRAFGADVKKSFPQYEACFATFENFVIAAFGKVDARGELLPMEQQTHEDVRMIQRWDACIAGGYNHGFDKKVIELFARYLTDQVGTIINAQLGLQARGCQWPSLAIHLKALRFFHQLACRSDDGEVPTCPSRHADVQVIIDRVMEEHDQVQHASP